MSLKNFDIVVAPEHDNLEGVNVISSKGAIHYITEEEVSNSKSYLGSKIKSQKIVSLILGGPNKYYNFNEKQLKNIFTKIRSQFIDNGYKVIVIPSMRTPKLIINLATKEFEEDGHVVKNVVHKKLTYRRLL